MVHTLLLWVKYSESNDSVKTDNFLFVNITDLDTAASLTT